MQLARKKAGTVLPDFCHSKRYEGSRGGYFFGTRGGATGYYRGVAKTTRVTLASLNAHAEDGP